MNEHRCAQEEPSNPWCLSVWIAFFAGLVGEGAWCVGGKERIFGIFILL